MKLLIMIPAYNEALNIRQVVQHLQSICPEYDYLIINDGSRDATARICRENRYPVLDLPVNGGLSNAIHAGMCYAKEKGYDMALQFDGDGQHDARFIREMVRVMEEHHDDIVIGSRFVTEKKPHSLRMMGNNLLQAVICLVTGGQNIHDTTSGMRLYNQRMIDAYADSINMGPEPDTIGYLLRCGARVEEVQVQMHERMAGVSYLTLGRSMKYMLEMCVSMLVVQWSRKKIQLEERKA